jgi:quinoprotein glucose dehydrogenase
VVAAEPNAQSAPAPPSIAPVAPLSWAIFAQEPLVQDPVSFCVAEDGSLFIAESFRQENGVANNRSSEFWLEDNLQLQSVGDCLKLSEKWASKRKGGIAYYHTEERWLTYSVDTGSDGLPTKSLRSVIL